MNDRVEARPISTFQALEQAALLFGRGEDGALFDLVLESVAQITVAGQVRLLAIGPGQGELRPLAGLDVAGKVRVIDPDVENLPLATVRQALAGSDIYFTGPTSDAAHGLIWPLRSGARALGLIYASQISPDIGETQFYTLSALVSLAAAALERAELNASLKATEQARRDFVSLTTHQLRVPLTSISGYTDLMLSGIAGPLTERQEQFVRTAQRNVARMSVLISDLSDLNRIQDARMPLNVTAIDLKALIESVLQEQAERFESRGHDLQLQLTDTLPAASGDGPAVKRVFAKILDNAIRYTPDGGSLTVGAVQYNGRLQVTVADNGIGIDEEDQAQLFTPFFRSETEAVRAHTGWGLSLALAQALLRAQGGELWFESQQGVGAVFHFTLPVASLEQQLPT